MKLTIDPEPNPWGRGKIEISESEIREFLTLHLKSRFDVASRNECIFVQYIKSQGYENIVSYYRYAQIGTEEHGWIDYYYTEWVTAFQHALERADKRLPLFGIQCLAVLDQTLESLEKDKAGFVSKELHLEKEGESVNV